MMMRHFDNIEYMKLLQKLDGCHAVFYQMWSSGKPRFTEEINTAAVGFNEDGQNIDFMINPTFWNTQTDTQKLFVLCHECSHIILQHGSRFFNKNSKIDMQVANKATDVAINHLLVNKLGFNRSEIDPNNVYCWTDTVFPEEKVPEEDKSSEWYYNALIDLDEQKDDNKTVDDHSMMSSSTDSAFEEMMQSVADSLSSEEKSSVQDLFNKEFESSDSNTGSFAGTGAGGIWATVDTTPVKKKKKWETVIKKWAMQYLRQIEREESQWARLNRRFVMLPDDMFIPTDMEIEEEEKKEERIQVWFFQDTSYSCNGYQQRFFDAAKSLPEERFDIRMFCFDTSVYETSLESGKLYGFGGTAFHILEQHIQRTIQQEQTIYPKAVFVITDGYGNRVNPAKPENWYWFLTPHHTKSYVPKESHAFKLVDFE